jgi:hypothetical protein
LKGSAASLKSLPDSVAQQVFIAFAHAFHDVFLFAIPFAIVALVTALFLKEKPLSHGHDTQSPIE